jgi:hypothetical protein
MHRTLKRRRPPGRTRPDQQQQFDHFRYEYNEQRHTALGQRPPADIWPSARAYPIQLREPTYPAIFMCGACAMTG